MNIFRSQKMRFLLVGAVNTAIGYGIFALALMILGEALYLPAYLIAYTLSILIGFILQRNVVFRVKGEIWSDLLRYVSVQLSSFLVNLALLPLLVEVFEIPALIAQGCVLLVTLVGSYFAHRYFSFRRKVTHDDRISDSSKQEIETP